MFKLIPVQFLFIYFIYSCFYILTACNTWAMARSVSEWSLDREPLLPTTLFIVVVASWRVIMLSFATKDPDQSGGRIWSSPIFGSSLTLSSSQCSSDKERKCGHVNKAWFSLSSEARKPRLQSSAGLSIPWTCRHCARSTRIRIWVTWLRTNERKVGYQGVKDLETCLGWQYFFCNRSRACE